MQSETNTQMIHVPPKPTCDRVSIFATNACKDLWNNYEQAAQERAQQELQIYVNRQKELASTQATAPLQQQIADLNKLATDQQNQIRKLTADQQSQIKTLNEQIQTQMIAASQSKLAAHDEGLRQGVGIGLGATLVLFGLVYGIRKLTRNFIVSKREQVKTASA